MRHARRSGADRKTTVRCPDDCPEGSVDLVCKDDALPDEDADGGGAAAKGSIMDTTPKEPVVQCYRALITAPVWEECPGTEDGGREVDTVEELDMLGTYPLPFPIASTTIMRRRCKQ